MSSNKLNASASSVKDKLVTLDRTSLNTNEKKLIKKAEVATRQPYSYERKALNSIHAHDIAKTKMSNRRKYELKQEIQFCTDSVKKSKLEAELASL